MKTENHDAGLLGNTASGKSSDPPSTSKHTPGPWAWEWVAEKSNEWAVGQAWREDGTPISGQIQEGEWLEDTIIERRLIGLNETGHANAADARLIAAAPELYEALHGLSEWFYYRRRTAPIDEARALLKRIDGE